ncbi:MAG: MBL fold metallo-hydrolase [Deltaproteobacteria bacterium]|nr:MBL fold metallo-hydrolase [Deltaproteobacteria bacterium]
MKLSDAVLIRKDPILLKQVRQMAPDFWWIEGWFPNVFFGQHVCSNAYLVKDDRNLVLIDNGRGPVMMEKLVSLIDAYAGQVDRLYMTLTQAHLDHAGNNEILDEHAIGETHFVLNERERPVLEFALDWVADFKAREPYYDWREDLSPILPLIPAIGKHSRELADMAVQNIVAMAYGGLVSKREQVEPLRMDECRDFTFGSVTVKGWPLGRLVLIPDCAHSPGHVSIYDPEFKIMIAGDVTIEINPVLMYSSVNGLIRYNGFYKTMAEEGYIEMAGDGHRSQSNWGQEVLARFPDDLRDKVREGDYIVGRDNCIRFFELFERFHRDQRDAVIAAHRNLGPAKVSDIAEAVRNRDEWGIRFMRATHSCLAAFPYPWRHLVCGILLEQGCRSAAADDGYPRFEPAETVTDEPRDTVPWRQDSPAA